MAFKTYTIILSMAVLVSACDKQEHNPELQLASEQVTQNYRDSLENEKKKVEYQLPKRAEGEAVSVTLADLKNMTKPEDFANALVSSDPQVRLTAVKALIPYAANLPDAPLQRLMNMLDAEKDKTIVVEVANLLGKSCHPAVMVMLLNNLKRDASTLNIEAMNVLGDVGGYRAVEGLEQLLVRLDDESPVVAQQIRPFALQARDKIMARNGQPLVCSW